MSRQKGSALLIVLLTMSLIITVTVLSNEYWQQVMVRSQDATERTRMKWILTGNENILQARLKKQEKIPVGAETLSLEGIRIDYKIRDLGDCFNLNALLKKVTAVKDPQSEKAAQQTETEKREMSATAKSERESEERKQGIHKGAEEEMQEGDYAKAVFTQLLKNVTGMSNEKAKEITQAVVLRMNPQEVPVEGGSSGSVTQQSDAQGPLLDSSELRTIAGIDIKTWQQLKRWVCVLPEYNLAININALTSEQGPLLAALFINRTTASAASRLISERPAQGWQDNTQLMNSIEWSNASLKKQVNNALVAESRYFSLWQWAVNDENDYSLRTLFIKDKEKIKIVQRRYGISDTY